ncbi:acyl-CoA carboxylase epsilon subunit [Streptomyces sp. NPDC014006]|uniref:acyl-CoA carboxylase epsilon subunit n=1 Tax=Streptomyces sp. NPDC014006 TaxID=3364870 RepID=UPI0036F7B8B3
MDEPIEPIEPREAAVVQPAFAVVRGRPDAFELAALTAVLLARLRAREDGAGGDEDGALRAPWDRPRRARPQTGWTARR